MGEFSGFYGIVYREWKDFLAEKSRLINTIFLPLLWFVAFGFAIGGNVVVDQVTYRSFIFPGIIMMSVLFYSIFSGSYLIEDKKTDIFKDIMVSPLSRFTIFLGKSASGVIGSLVQTLILLGIGTFLGISVPLSSVIPILGIVFLISLIFVSIGLMIGTFMESSTGFGLVITFLVYPMVFFSGAFNKLEGLPAAIDFATKINPLTYGIDALRHFLSGEFSYSLTFDITIISILAVLFVILGTLSFRRLR